jgi:hypothetical protein
LTNWRNPSPEDIAYVEEFNREWDEARRLEREAWEKWHLPDKD